MLGMAPNIIKINGNNYSNCGFYIYLPSSHKYSQKGDSHTVYSNGSIAQGTVYSIKFDKKKGEITYFLNGATMGLAYSGLDKKLDLYPAFDFCTSGGEVELVKPKFKK